MVKNIHIRNFKSIVDLDIELGQLNVFIGENGCGKTNILEAVACCSVVAENFMLPESLLGLRGVRLTEPNLMKAAFSGIPVSEIPKSGISVGSSNRTIKVAHIHLSNENNEEFQVQMHDIQNSSWIVGFGLSNIRQESHEYFSQIQQKNNQPLGISSNTAPYAFKLYLQKMFGENSISTFLNYTPENFFLRRFEEEGQVRPLGIRGEGLFKHLVDLHKNNPASLVEIGENLRLIGWFEGFEIPKDLMFTEKRINIKDKYLAELDFFDQRSANEGFLYLLFYFTLFISPLTPHFFAIDNIDNSLNPKLCAELIRRLAKLAKANNKQVILTTHNPAILDGLDLEDDSQRLFTISRNIDGHTIAKRVLPPKKIEGIEPVRLSEAYIRGYLGGLPKNF